MVGLSHYSTVECRKCSQTSVKVGPGSWSLGGAAKGLEFITCTLCVCDGWLCFASIRELLSHPCLRVFETYFFIRAPHCDQWEALFREQKMESSLLRSRAMARLRVLVAVQDCKCVCIKCKACVLPRSMGGTLALPLSISQFGPGHARIVHSLLMGTGFCLEYYCVCPADGLEIVHYLVCSLDSHKRAKVRVM